MISDLICSNISSTDGTLFFAGQNTLSLAEKYGTPLYLMDEDRIREMCRMYRSSMSAAFGDKFQVYYASKASSFTQMYRIMAEEQMGIDVVSCGEIRSALNGGFPLERAVFHSNNKTDEDIAYAIEHGVGLFVVDNKEELYAIDRIAREMGKVQGILLRITPGIDPHTYAAISTGKVDSKFGSAIETGQAEEITRLALSFRHIRLKGFHCHVGSQVFDSDVFIQCAEVMLRFIADMQNKVEYTAEILDLGGGFGVRYLSSQPTPYIPLIIDRIGVFMRQFAKEIGIELPVICIEPGRSIVADAGMTLYTVGTLKHIPGYKNYISVDGGMSDNPRYALYKSPYTIVPAGKMDEDRDMTCTIAGRCCESGDVLQENVPLPSSMKRGDILACFTTGAYHYSMASNYNRIPRPPIVMLKGGENYVAVRRETINDLVALDI